MQNEIMEALAERDQAIEKQLTKLSDQSVELRDRMMGLEQNWAAKDFTYETSSAHRHSIGRVFKSLADPRGKVDGLEAEWSQEYEHKSGLKIPGAVWIPLNAKAVDFASESPTSAGSSLAETELRSSEFIDLFYQSSTAARLGRMLQADGLIDIPKASSGITSGWFGGDGDAMSETEGVYTTLQLSPKFCYGYTKVTYKTDFLAKGGAVNVIVRDLMAAIGSEFDNQVFNGDGTSYKPTGILQTSGINAHTYTSSPKAVQWSDVVQMEVELINDKVPLTPGRMHYIAGSTAYKLCKTVSRAGTEATFLADFQSGRPTLNGYPLHVSTHVPANQLVLGNFDDLLIVNFGAIAVATDEYTNFSTGTVGIRGILPVDVGVKRPVSFCVAS